MYRRAALNYDSLPPALNHMLKFTATILVALLFSLQVHNSGIKKPLTFPNFHETGAQKSFAFPAIGVDRVKQPKHIPAPKGSLLEPEPKTRPSSNKNPLEARIKIALRTRKEMTLLPLNFFKPSANELYQHLKLFFSEVPKTQPSLPLFFENYWENITSLPEFKSTEVDVIYCCILIAIRGGSATSQVMEDLLSASHRGSGLSLIQQKTIYDLIEKQCHDLQYFAVSYASFEYLLRLVLSMIKHYGSGFNRQTFSKFGIYWIIPQLSPILKPLFTEQITFSELSEVLTTTFTLNDNSVLTLQDNQLVALDYLFHCVFFYHRHTNFNQNPSLNSTIVHLIKKLIPEIRLQSAMEYCVKKELKYLFDATLYAYYDLKTFPLGLYEISMASNGLKEGSRITFLTIYLAHMPVFWDDYVGLDRKNIVNHFNNLHSQIEFVLEKYERKHSHAAAVNEESSKKKSAVGPLKALQKSFNFVTFLDILVASSEEIPLKDLKMRSFEPTGLFLKLYNGLLTHEYPILLELARIFLSRQTGNPISCFSYWSNMNEEINWQDMMNYINLHLFLLKQEESREHVPFAESIDQIYSTHLLTHVKVGSLTQSEESFYTEIPVSSVYEEETE